MKYNLFALGVWLFAMVMAGACIDDRGNYDYLPERAVMPAVISGLEDSYAFELGSGYRLTATVDSVEGMENLRYMWYMYEAVASGKRDTLGYGKTLDFKADYKSGKYSLWFEVRDTVADVCVDKEMEVKIESFLGTAWVVLKTTDGATDMDAVLADRTVRENLLTEFGIPRLQGKAVKVAYNVRHQHEVEDEDGTVKVLEKKAFTLLSDQDLCVCDAESMELLKDAANCFYEAPAVLKPMDILTPLFYTFFINAGKYYKIIGTGPNVGKFGYPHLGLDGTDSYELFGKLLLGPESSMGWDKVSRSFIYMPFGSSKIDFFNEPSGEENYGPTRNLPAEMVQLLERGELYNEDTWRYEYTGYAILKENDGNYSIADILFKGAGGYPLRGYYHLPEGCRVGTSGILGAHKVAPAIFFAQGDELWVHNINGSEQDAARLERKLYSFSGEQITYVRHVKVETWEECLVDVLLVLTHTGDNWKMYAFPFIGGGSEFDTSAAMDDIHIATGKGEAGYVIRMQDGKAY